MILTGIKHGAISGQVGSQQMDNILNSYRNSNDAIAQMIARDFDEAFQVSRTKNWKEAKYDKEFRVKLGLSPEKEE